MSAKYFTKYIEYNTNNMLEFAKRLIELRKENHISQAQLAKKIGVSCSVVCYWETDRSEPTAPNLIKLSEYFDVSVDYLLGREDY